MRRALPLLLRLLGASAALGLLVWTAPATASTAKWADAERFRNDAPRDIRGRPGLTDVLLPRVAVGDEAATQACLARYGGVVWTLARRFSSTPAEAEDAVQEIFLDLWRSADRFDPSRGTELAFVAVIARRRLIDRRRAERRRPLTEAYGEQLATLPAPQALTGEVSAEVALTARALGELSHEQRDVLLLSAVEGLSHEEIARSRGMALGTVKSHARRALLRMRSLLLGGRSSDPQGFKGGSP